MASSNTTPDHIRPEPPLDKHHHRDIRGGAARAAVFGVSDGLVSNVGLILGVAGADPAPSVIRIAGLAGLIAGGISMAAGEYNSMLVQRELFERELERERIAIRDMPHVEAVELAQLYESRGIDAGVARDMATTVMANEDLALRTHAREELGIDPDELGAPKAAAAASLFAFAGGAGVPLLPWFFADGNGAIVASLLAAMIAAIVIGWFVGQVTERPRWRTSLRQVALTAIPAAVTYAIGSVVGVTV